jgi:threonine 3-dehydrogenase
MAVMITGGMGYLGSLLAHLLIENGQDPVLFDININPDRVKDIADRVKTVQGDVSDLPQVLNVLKGHEITEIYHLGGLLTHASEANHNASFKANVIGTYNVLEAARLCDVPKLMFASTIGTFGANIGEVVDDLTLQRPLTMYGCGKLYGENLGLYYRQAFNLDFRSLRYPPIIGPGIRTPGHWAPVMIEDAVKGVPHRSIYGNPDMSLPLMYIRDAARAAYMLMQAPKERIKMINYNAAAIPGLVTARDIENALKRKYPDAVISYASTECMDVANVHSQMKVFDDSTARREWGWQPEYDSIDKVIDAFKKDI